jgi:hypothetical protein
MPEDEFWNCTPRYFDALVKAYETRQKIEMERLRMSTYMICAPYLRKHTTPQKFWPLPWEKAQTAQWQPIDPTVLANFERNADETIAQMRANKQGD